MPRPLAIAVGLAFCLIGSAPAGAQLRGDAQALPAETVAPPAYHIKPPEMTIPPGTKPGTLRRLIQPFGPWTLICDENLNARRRLCNTSQTILDAAGRMAFSWSLAATQQGTPVFILRVPARAGPNGFAHLDFGHATAADVVFQTCDATLCIGFLPDDAKIQKAINAGAAVHVQLPGGIRVEAPLEGLAAAVGSLR